MKTKRIVRINKDGVSIPNTFNKTPPLNIYKNDNSRLQYPKGCVGPGCKLCNCTLILQIENLDWDTWSKPDGFNYGQYLGKKNLYTYASPQQHSNSEIGFIKDVILPKGNYNLIGCTDSSSSFPIDIDLILNSAQDNCDIPFGKGIYFENTNTNIINGSTNYFWDIIIPPNIKRAGAPFRAPIAGYRKSLVCCSGNNCLRDESLTDDCNITIDSFGNKTINNNKIKQAPSNTVYRDSIYCHLACYDKRIRSGMQPKQKCSLKYCNKKCCEKEYSFSYSEYNKNRALNTYDRGLERNNTLDRNRNNSPNISYLNGKCNKSAFIKSSTLACDISCCNANNITVWKPNNKTFKVQGAVSSSSRVDRLKLDTLRVANSKCSGDIGTADNSRSRACDENKIGKGKYFAGQPRFDGWMFNSTHPETVCNTRFRQLPFGVPQLTRNLRPTRTNKMVGINLRQKNNGMGIFKRYYTNRSPACNYSSCNDNGIGENMKCPHCFNNGYHYHSSCNDSFKNHGPIMNMKTMCKTCMSRKGESHYHKC
jgi:hypothetical protein